MRHRVQGGWRASASVFLTAIVLLAASSCGNSGASTSSLPAAGTSATAAPVNYRYLNPALFPEKDTPLSQASAQLQQVWTAYDVTIIPSRHVLDNMPAPPTVINKTNGALTDADAQALAWAEYRQSAFIGWMEGAIQPKFDSHLRAQGLFNGPIGGLVRSGAPVTDPACDLYATAIAVVPVDGAIKTFEAGRGYTATSGYALITKYSGNPTCTVAAGDGKSLFSFGSSVGIETGTLRQDDVLGAFFYQDSGRDCSAGAPQQPAACGDLP